MTRRAYPIDDPWEMFEAEYRDYQLQQAREIGDRDRARQILAEAAIDEAGEPGLHEARWLLLGVLAALLFLVVYLAARGPQ